MADMEKLNEENLEEAAGGKHHYHTYSTNERHVANLQSGYLAMRTEPNYDYNNEIRGCELYNGYTVYIEGDYVRGYDGRTYVWVYSPKHGRYGYVNASYLGW